MKLHQPEREAAAMTNAQMFKAAHAMTRQTIAKHGKADYQLTFGAALKAIREAQQMKKHFDVREFLADAFDDSVISVFFTVFMMMALYLVGLAFGNEETANMGVVAGAVFGLMALAYSLADAYKSNVYYTKG